MARFTSYLVAVLIAAGASQVDAAPLVPRQKGNIACNLARIQIVSALQTTTRDVKKLNGAAGSDTSVADAAAAAQAGLKQAQGGIQQIASAILTNQAPPQAGRDLVAQGLGSAKTALDGINSTAPAVTQQVNTAKSNLDRTIAAGNRVVENCGGGGGAADSATISGTASSTVTDSANVTETVSDTASATVSANATETVSVSVSATANATETLTLPPSASATDSASANVTESIASATADVAESVATGNATNTFPPAATVTVTVTADGADVNGTATLSSEAGTASAATNKGKAKGRKNNDNANNNPTVIRTSRLHRRQIGNLKCNIARLQAVRGLSASVSAVNKVGTAGGSDAAVATAVKTAQDALKSSQQGIATIAKALLTGQQAPASGRIQVVDGLNTADDALGSLDVDSAAVTSAIAAAQKEIATTLSAGQAVQANCK